MTSQDNVSSSLELPLARVIYDAQEIAAAVHELAVEILAATPPGGEIMLLVVLEGARRFGEDLHTELLALPQSLGRTITVATVGVSSYGPSTQSSGVVKLLTEPSVPLQGRYVVIIDDILDQGHTMRYLMSYCRALKPQTLRSCVLFDKRDVKRDFRPDFVGLEVPAVFVVGYGLDYQENFRNLPYLAALDEVSMNRKVASDVQTSSGQRERA